MTPSSSADHREIMLRVARPDEAAHVVSILEEAAQWLTARDILQWTPGTFSQDEVRQWMSTGTVLVAWRDAEAIGTITFSLKDDELWQALPPARARYIYKLAVRRGVAGAGVSLRLLHAAETAMREQGCAVARLDCWAGNDALQQLYNANGYSVRGSVAEQDWECALLEKALA